MPGRDWLRWRHAAAIPVVAAGVVIAADAPNRWVLATLLFALTTAGLFGLLAYREGDRATD